MEGVSTSEKRAIRRFSLQLPVIVNAVSESGATVQTTAETRDVSSNGICFYCDAAIERSSEIEFTVTLPAEVTMTEPLKVLCHGTVLRRRLKATSLWSTTRSRNLLQPMTRRPLCDSIAHREKMRSAAWLCIGYRFGGVCAEYDWRGIFRRSERARLGYALGRGHPCAERLAG